ncbi:MAG: hypothetical protein ACD_48C00343G0003 [uncultured bacterium]|nr:MAG: hypothetical protein ACD_48C00343G0003 [uncultured bacterium]
MDIRTKRNILFFSLIGIFSLLFSSYLMFHTFSYDGKNSSMLIASKAWSDFGAHIPLIRSFSLGNNWPPEYPLFPGEPIRYHFLFYFLVGMLEKAGLRIDWALNIPSIIGFTGLMIGIAVIAQKLFKDKRITILSLLFFLFNGSLSFVRFFQTHSVKEIMTNTTFPSFAPWGPGEITAFWNLNIYTNQRHLAFAFALALLFIGILLYIEKMPLKKQLFFLIPEVFILAIMPYFHQPILVILAVFMACYFVLFPHLRVLLLLIGAVGAMYIFPQLLPLISGQKTIHWNPGYLMSPPLAPLHILWYWIQNLGLHFFLIPLGWILAPARIKKITIPLLFVFIIPNLFQFSVEMAANHKFFNFYLILGNMLSAYVLIKICSCKYIGKLVGSIALIGLIFSGIIDFFPVYNDEVMTLQDIPANNVATWIKDNTPPDAIFLNSSYFFHPASIAGRKILLGWPYFSWSAGYNTDTRWSDMKTLYETTNPTLFCHLISKYHVSYISYQKPEVDNIHPNITMLESQAEPVFTGQENTYFIYKLSTACYIRG